MCTSALCFRNAGLHLHFHTNLAVRHVYPGLSPRENAKTNSLVRISVPRESRYSSQNIKSSLALASEQFRGLFVYVQIKE